LSTTRSFRPIAAPVREYGYTEGQPLKNRLESIAIAARLDPAAAIAHGSVCAGRVVNIVRLSREAREAQKPRDVALLRIRTDGAAPHPDTPQLHVAYHGLKIALRRHEAIIGERTPLLETGMFKTPRPPQPGACSRAMP
jgi:hypothetical protein